MKIKYENLILNPKNEFIKITNFLSSIGDFKFDENKVLKTINNCSFENFVKRLNIFFSHFVKIIKWKKFHYLPIIIPILISGRYPLIFCTISPIFTKQL